jgi:hypothetical protein
MSSRGGFGRVTGVAWLLLSLTVAGRTGGTQAQPPPEQAGALPSVASSIRYRVNYRPSDDDPWQLYSELRRQQKANALAEDVRKSGYQAEVVDHATPSPPPYPNPTDTSASDYDPTSNRAADSHHRRR